MRHLSLFLSLVLLPWFQEHPKLSPFSAVRWQAATPEVEVGGAWHGLVELDGVEASTIIGFCQKTYGSRWRKRFEEDLVEVLAGMGKAPGKRVDLVLKDLTTGAVARRKGVEMTEENRRRIRNAAQDRDDPGRRAPAAAPHPGRAHAAVAPPPLRWLTDRFESPNPAAAPRLTREQAEADLDELEGQLETVYSYRDHKGVDFRAALDAVRASLGDGISRGAFAIQLMKVLSLFGDGHSGLTEDPSDLLPPGWSPLLVEESKGGLVAFAEDRSGFADDRFPLIRKIDGLPIERWIEAAAEIVPKGSPQFLRAHAIRNLRFIGYLRAELGLPARDEVSVELGSLDGKSSVARDRALSRRVPKYGVWPRGGSRLLEQGIGYLRIESMDDEPSFLDELTRRIEEFRAARALVVDVRGNGGGSRDALRAIHPFLAPPGAAPRVVNVAAYRLAGDEPRGRKEGYLEDRFLYPLTSTRWTAAERQAVETFAKGFRPAWTPPEALFSDWHYFVLSAPAADVPANQTPVRQETIVLMDGGCFSATDILLGALKGVPGVTLLGTSSSGGSGRARRVTLTHSKLALRLSTMASFRPDGRLYEGSGIEPDVRAETIPTDLIGRTDSVLEEALRRLR